MITLVNRVVSKMKNEEYRLDNSIKTTDLTSIIFQRVLMLARGSLKKALFKSSGKRLFVGKRTKILHKGHIEVGNSVTLNDYVELNGLSSEGLKMKNNINIGKYSIISCTGSLKQLGKGISIGNNFGCGDWCFFGCAGGIKIGDNVIMGQNVRMHSENHNFDRTDIPIKEQGVTNQGIIIEDDCWIGAGTVILDGVTIGRGSVIGANTVVNKSIEPYSIAVGHPVNVVKKRITA